MHNHTPDRMQKIRLQVREADTALLELKRQLVENDDKYLNYLLRQVSNGLYDIEAFFLTPSKNERVTAPHTIAEESKLLDYAEFHLHHVVMPQLKAIQDLIAKFGPDVRPINEGKR